MGGRYERGRNEQSRNGRREKLGRKGEFKSVTISNGGLVAEGSLYKVGITPPHKLDTLHALVAGKHAYSKTAVSGTDTMYFHQAMKENDATHF